MTRMGETAVVSGGTLGHRDYTTAALAVSIDLLRSVLAKLDRLLDPYWQLFDALFGPGTLDGDLYLVRTTADLAALERLSRRLRWSPHDPRAREAMRVRIAELGREQAYLLTFAPALLLAAGRMGEPQRMRFGRDYLVGDDGKPVMVAPEHLPMAWAWRWLRKETINAMEADLLEEAYMTTDAAQGFADGVDLALVASEAPDPEEALLLAEVSAERERLLSLLLERCTPAERRLLAALAAQPTLAAAARELGISDATARVQYLNIRRKARTLRHLAA